MGEARDIAPVVDVEPSDGIFRAADSSSSSSSSSTSTSSSSTSNSTSSSFSSTSSSSSSSSALQSMTNRATEYSDCRFI